MNPSTRVWQWSDKANRFVSVSVAIGGCITDGCKMRLKDMDEVEVCPGEPILECECGEQYSRFNENMDDAENFPVSLSR